MLNVREAGAVGDGVTDDYPAIQALANVVQMRKRQWQPVGGCTEFQFPGVVFPPGDYVLSQPVEWGGCANLVADGSAIIRPASVGFRFTGGYIVRIDGLTFANGQKAVEFTNNNSNGARLELQSCRFQGQCGYSITAQPVAGEFFSSHVVLKSCKWFNCYGAFQSAADVNTLRDCWLQWAAANTVDAIPYYIQITGGRLNIDGGMWVPVFPNGSNGHRWVGFTAVASRNTGAGVFATGTEFHGEWGGLPIVEITGSPDLASPFQGAVVSLIGTQHSPGQTAWPDNGVILCKNGLPQIVIVSGCSGLSGATLIRDVTGDSQTLFNALSHGADRFRVLIGANSGYPLVPPIPAWMVPYTRNQMV